MDCNPKRVKVTVGEDKDFKIYLRDEDTGQPINLNAYVSGTLKFVNCNEIVITKTLTIPGANPIVGEVLVSLTNTETSQFDESITDMQLELVNGALNKIIIIKNKLEVIEALA